LKLIKWNFYGNNELDGESHDSDISDDTSASDFDFDYNELELSDEDLDVSAEELSLTNKSNVADSGFPSISLIEQTPVLIFRTFFTEKILNLITIQTNIYRKGKKRRNNHNKIGHWKDMSKKQMESFLGLIILMGINNLPNETLLE
jgi:hypothetical protein